MFTRQRLIDEVTEGSKRRTELLKKKGMDYSLEENALLNFEQISMICDILDIDSRRSSEDAALFFVVHKLQRYCNLRGREASNETIQDTIDDIHNYIDLVAACGKEIANET